MVGGIFVTMQTAYADEVSSLAAVNAGTEVFSDFASAGVTGAVESKKFTYDTLIALVKADKGSDLTLPEVQDQVSEVNNGNPWSTGASNIAAIGYNTSVVYSGKIYSWGGFDGSSPKNSLYIYDIGTNVWTTGDSGGTKRNNHASVL